MSGLIGIVATLMYVLGFAIFARTMISWFPIDPQGPVVQALDAITEPVLGPMRRVIPRIGMIDITPMVAILLLFGLAGMLSSS